MKIILNCKYILETSIEIINDLTDNTTNSK
jgi:hypothetical protein